MQTMRANKETVAALSKKIEQLNKIIMNVVQKVERRAASRGMEKSELWKNVQATNGWQNRVHELKESVHFAKNSSKYRHQLPLIPYRKEN